MEIKFTVLGQPFGKQRPRLTTYGGYAHAYTPKETINYESKVLFEFKQVCKEYPTFKRDELVKCKITAYFSLSKGDYGKKGLNKSGREKIEQHYCTKHLDTDNIAKIILDALNGIAFVDDKQIVILEVQKIWTEQEPKVEVELCRQH